MTHWNKIAALCLCLLPQLLWGQDRICLLQGEESYKLAPLSNQVLEAFSDSVLTVNVVVHVVSNSIFNDIADSVIVEQINVLNQDYNRQNADTTDVPDAFKHLAGNPGIRFKLADRDTLGNPTSGIVRRRTTIGNFWIFDRLQQTDLGGSDPWDQSRYLNIWVAQLSSSLPGYSNTPDFIGTLQDGVSIDYRAFGTSGSVREPFLFGRTATHELGHYFGLKHIWGPTGVGCVEDDGIEDTPNQMNSTSGCFIDQQSCGTPDMRSNFMDYTNDVCMNLFTHGQADRMRSTLLTLRSSLLEPLPVSTSEELPAPTSLDVDVFPNPNAGQFTISFSDTISGPSFEPVQISIFDLMGRKVFQKTRATLIQEEIELPELPAGQYLLHIQRGESVLNRSVHIFNN